MARTDITSGFKTWLVNSVAVMLIIATAAMGMMAGNMRAQPAGGAIIEANAVHPDALISHLQNGDGHMLAMLSAAGMACCPCETGELCLAEPPDAFVLLSSELSGVNLTSLTSRPPAAPPRT